MSTVLVTGAGGVLGSRVARAARQAGHVVRPAGRRAPPGGIALDVRRPETFGRALEGVDAVVHCAADPLGDAEGAEAAGLRNLLAALPHARFVYPSIVGSDRIRYPYYRAKVAAEVVLAGSGADWAVQRITQFFEFADFLATLPEPAVAEHFKTQAVSAAEAASHLVALLEGQATGRVPDLGGPEVLELRDMVQERCDRSGRGVTVRSVPSGAFSEDLARGYQLCPDRAVGTRTWAEHLAGTR